MDTPTRSVVKKIKTLNVSGYSQKYYVGRVMDTGGLRVNHALFIDYGDVQTNSWEYLERNHRSRSILIQPCRSMQRRIGEELDTASLPYEIEPGELIDWASQAKEALRNPDTVGRGLKHIDEQLGQAMGWNEAPPQNPPVDTLLLGKTGLYTPSLPPAYRPFRNEGALDAVLLRDERTAGLNKDGSAMFYGYVTSKEAKKYVENGNIFKEIPMLGRMLSHGKQTHRLQLACIRSLMNSQMLKRPNMKNGKALNDQQILQALLLPCNGGEYDGQKLWDAVIDSFDENPRGSIEEEFEEFRELDERGLNGVAPNEFHQNLSCFGGSFDPPLPNLERYLTDSIFKQIVQQAERLITMLDKHAPEYLDKIAKDANITGEELRKNPAYFHDAVALNNESMGMSPELAPSLQLTRLWNIPLDLSEAKSMDYQEHTTLKSAMSEHRSKYVPFLPGTYADNIVKKKDAQTQRKGPGQYEDWSAYLSSKKRSSEISR